MAAVASFFAGLWTVIKLLPQLISLFNTVLGMIKDWQNSQIDEQAKRESDAVRKLKEAQTEQEVKDATKDIARNSF